MCGARRSSVSRSISDSRTRPNSRFPGSEDRRGSCVTVQHCIQKHNHCAPPRAPSTPATPDRDKHHAIDTALDDDDVVEIGILSNSSECILAEIGHGSTVRWFSSQRPNLVLRCLKLSGLGRPDALQCRRISSTPRRPSDADAPPQHSRWLVWYHAHRKGRR